MATYDLRPVLAFLLPDGTDPLTIPTITAGAALSSDLPAVVIHGRCSPGGTRMQRTLGPSDLTERHAFWAVPAFYGMPRALIPAGDRDAIRTLLAPRATADAPVARTLHRGFRAIPVNVLLSLGRPLVLAARERSSTVNALDAMAPSAAIGCYLGTRVNEGRLSAQAFVEGHVRAVAKVVQEHEGRSRVVHEARLLTELAKMPSLQKVVPRLGAHLSTSFGEVLVTDAFPGTPPASTIDSQASDFLARCWLGRPRPAGQAELIRRAESNCVAAGYGELVRGARAGLEREVVPTVITHGDFVPWNARIHHGCLAVFDWEYGCIDGVPDWDDLFFRVQVGIIKLRWRGAQLAGAVQDWLARPRLLWSTSAQRSLAVLVLLDLAARYQRRRDRTREHLVLAGARAIGLEARR